MDPSMNDESKQSFSSIPTALLQVGEGSQSRREVNVPLPSDHDPTRSIQSPAISVNYKQIVINRNLFMATLKTHHLLKKKNFWIPIVGGSPLDLHRLFVAVTISGGMKKVTREREWIKVVRYFKFPQGATNASHILRKHYDSILKTYEDTYFLESDRVLVDNLVRKLKIKRAIAFLNSEKISNTFGSSTDDCDRKGKRKMTMLDQYLEEHCKKHQRTDLSQFKKFVVDLKDKGKAVQEPQPPTPKDDEGVGKEDLVMDKNNLEIQGDLDLGMGMDSSNQNDWLDGLDFDYTKLDIGTTSSFDEAKSSYMETDFDKELDCLFKDDSSENL